MDGTYEEVGSYRLPCATCSGAGCVACDHTGQVKVYILESGTPAWRCEVWHHKYIGSSKKADSVAQLPMVTWCQRQRCSWRRVQTDVPEAYP